MKTARPRPTDNPQPDVALASMQRGQTIARPSSAGSLAQSGSPRTPAAAPIKPFEPNANVFLFTPASTYRTRYAATSGRPDMPEYPSVGARVDYYISSPSGEVKLEILDAAGKVVRSYTSESRGGGRGGRGGGR